MAGDMGWVWLAFRFFRLVFVFLFCGAVASPLVR